MVLLEFYWKVAEAWDGPSHGLGLCYLLLVRCHFENFCGLSRCSSGSIGEQQKHVIGTLISFVSYVVEAASFRLSCLHGKRGITQFSIFGEVG